MRVFGSNLLISHRSKFRRRELSFPSTIVLDRFGADNCRFFRRGNCRTSEEKSPIILTILFSVNIQLSAYHLFSSSSATILDRSRLALNSSSAASKADNSALSTSPYPSANPAPFSSEPSSSFCFFGGCASSLVNGLDDEPEIFLGALLHRS